MSVAARRMGAVAPLAQILATNVRGPSGIGTLLGHRVESVYPLAPIAEGLGLSVAGFSYGGFLHVGLHADHTSVPDLESLRGDLEDAFETLLDASTARTRAAEGA